MRYHGGSNEEGTVFPMKHIIRKRIFIFLLCAALTLSLTACGAGGTGSTDSTAVIAEDESYDAENAVSLVFSDGGVSGGGSGAEIDGTAVTIDAAGTYVLSGSCADGSVKVKKGTTGVTLVLNGLSLTSADTAPILCGKSTEVTILVLSGTVNALSDSSENNDESCPDNANAENAVIKCKDGSAVTLCGGGTLNITALGKNGIKSGATTETEGEASLTIRSLTLDITAAVNDAVNAEQLLNIESGTLTISAADDAIHCDYVLNVGADGTDGPAITVTGCYEGLEAAELNIFSGDISVTSTDDCLNAANSELADYDFAINISGGTISAYSSAGDGFDSNGELNISGGTVVVWTANSADNQPLDADGSVNITGGTVLAAGASSGMGMTLSAAQPYVVFGGGMGMGGGMGGGAPADMGERPELPSGEAGAGMGERPELPSGEAGADMGERPEMPSGEAGADMGERPEMPSGEAGAGMGGSGVSIAAGSTVTLQDADGNVLYSGEAPCAAGYVFFSSAGLTDGASYSLLSGGESLAESTASTAALSEGFGGGGRGGRAE